MPIPAAGNDIEKTDIITEFTTTVINVANAAVVYNLSSNPLTAAGYPALPNANLSNTQASAPVAANFSTDIDAAGTASAIAEVLRTFAYNASRIRQVTYQYSGGTIGVGVSLMNDSHRQAAILSAGTPPVGGTDIVGGGAGSLQTFINGLASALAAARGNNVTLNACHSSCHVSCHGARGRR